jgi:hypothetical protein
MQHHCPSSPDESLSYESCAPYYSINPALLEAQVDNNDNENNQNGLNIHNQLNFRELQLLCIELGLGGRGSRVELMNKLTAWNKANLKQSKYYREHKTNNLHLVDISDAAHKLHSLNTTPRKLIQSKHNSNVHTFTCPALNRRNVDGTPISILSSNNPRSCYTPNSRTGKRLSFSLLNEVKIIPQHNRMAELIKAEKAKNEAAAIINQHNNPIILQRSVSDPTPTSGGAANSFNLPEEHVDRDLHLYSMEDLSNSFALLTTIA